METQENIPSLNVSLRYIKPGRYNPRTYFKKSAIEELAESIKGQGLLQPILVRPVDGSYEIIAGHRRFAAAKIALGEDASIPVYVREMSDEEAELAATNENVIREDMSPAEEAEAAARVLAKAGGDKEEAARLLKWSVPTLEKRLALMNCSENVRKALTEEKILLGHAELLAAAPKDKQDNVLDKLLALDKKPSVAEFKADMMRLLNVLSTAIFDKSDCASCQYNSSIQSGLFSESVGEGNCTNPVCFNQKTEEELTSRADALKDEYPVVRIVKPGDNHIVIRIVAEGDKAVGEEQAKACRACANFGAAVLNIPGNVGKVCRDQCFDTVCNASKVAAYIKSKAPVTVSKVPADSTKKDASSKPSAVKTEVSDSLRVKEYRIKQWRLVLKSELMRNKEKNNLILIALAIGGYGRWISGTNMSTAFEKVTGEKPESVLDVLAIAKKLEALQSDAVELLHTAIAASTESNVEVRQMQQILEFLDAKLENHWKVNQEYLDLLTKSEIEVVADEIGLKAHIGDNFSKLMGGKKEELIKSLLNAEGFVFEGKIPKNMALS